MLRSQNKRAYLATIEERFTTAAIEEGFKTQFLPRFQALGSKVPHYSNSSTARSILRHSVIKHPNTQGPQGASPLKPFQHPLASQVLQQFNNQHPNPPRPQGASSLKPFQEPLASQNLQQSGSHPNIQGPQVTSPLEPFNGHSSLKIFNKSSISTFKATKWRLSTNSIHSKLSPSFLR
ncbi:unnamed protein product, partial [Closterium sp. NIES-65]